MRDLAALHSQLRPLMFSVAYRMLGTVTEAEDVVQEALLRLHTAPDSIENPEAYAVTVTTRLAIDQLRSARLRREHYVGPWLPEPLVTDGDDDPAAARVERAREISLAVYSRAADAAAQRGLIVADTKFELGLIDGELVLGDEVLTPDSSRFWPAATWAPGSVQPSYDKQYVRDWLTSSGWDRVSPPPELPSDVVEATRERYVTAYEQLTGRPFA